jgi:hypothetical protein
MQGKKNPANDDPDLVFGLRNIAAVDGSPVTTTLFRATRGELPVARLGHIYVGNRKLLLLARARREAAQAARREATPSNARELEGVM